MANDEEGGNEGKSSFVSANLPKIIAVLVILLLVGSLATYKFMHWMEEDEQCGGICHNHQEYNDVYMGTVHQQAGVMCKDCHVKEGLKGYITSQIHNTGNVYKFYIKGGVYKESFDKIKADVDEREWLFKSAPMETCQRSGCHSNNKFAQLGDTRGYEYDVSMFTAAGEQSQRSPEDEVSSGALVSENTNDHNTQGVLSFHQLHIQAPTEAEASWVSFGFRDSNPDGFVKPHCQDCHGNMMTDDVPVYDDNTVQQEGWIKDYQGIPVIGRGAWAAGTRQRVPIDMCITCHDGEKAPGIYGNTGGEFPTDLPS